MVVKQDSITRKHAEIACTENGYEGGEVMQYLLSKEGEKFRGEGSSEWEEEREKGLGLKKGGRRRSKRSRSLFRGGEANSLIEGGFEHE